MSRRELRTVVLIISMAGLLIGTLNVGIWTTDITGPEPTGIIPVGDVTPSSVASSSTRGNEELRQLSVNYRQIRGGLNTHGFIDVDESNGHVYYHNSYRESTVYKYTSLDNFKNNNGQQQLNLPRRSEGTYHCIYRNHLYYAAYGSNLLVKCRVSDMREILTRNLAGAGSHNQAHFNWGGYTDINLMSDETGLYVTWATSTSAHMKLSRLDENLNVQQTWDTGRNKGNVGWAFMVGGVLYWGNQYSSDVFNYKLDTSTSQVSSYSNSLGAGGYITHTSYNGKDNSLLVWNQGNVYHYPEIGGVRITRAESARLRGSEEYEGICYARRGPYVMSVNVTTTETLDDVAEMEVWLDYNTTNATLGFNWTREKFYKSGDTGDDVEVFLDDCIYYNDGEQKWTVNFSLMFNFTFPHEKMLDCYVKTTAKSGDARLDRFKDLCRVENDLEFLGTPKLVGEQQGRIEEGDWVKGGQNITIDNMTVVYSGTSSLYPDDGFFNVKIEDSSGNVWWDNGSGGNEVELNIRSGSQSDELESYRITIVDIPDSGICMTNFTFPVRIDAEPPVPPLNLLCHADGFKGRDTEYTDVPETFVTWDEVMDHGSGLSGYYYSLHDNSGTDNGTFTVDREVQIGDLEEGFVSVHVWCADLVGNIGQAASSGILVDLTPPMFTNYTPVDGAWHNKSQVVCSVEVGDEEGSGVDGTTIEYSVSLGGHLNFQTWMPAGLISADHHLFPSVDYYFQEGEDNHIKWRAKDLSGNGYVESLPTNIKVDTTSVSFEDVISPNDEWYDHSDITTKIRISDTGSGVDPASIQVRRSVTGPGGFGPWKNVPAENVTEVKDGKFEITVTQYYEEGKSNYIMFRGRDLVGNSYGVSKAFNLKIDTSPVYFRGFFPDELSYSNEKKVECSVSIMDDGTGVDTSSVEYSVSTDGPAEEKYGRWNTVTSVFPGNPTLVVLEVEFEWGMNNYIRFRADDVIGTGINTSAGYVVWVNSEPVPEISSPLNGEEYSEGSEIQFNASLSWDADGDELTYYWTSNVSANTSLGYGSHFSTRPVPGKHAITLHVSDGHGYNVSKKLLLTIKEREKKPEKNNELSIIPDKGSGSFWFISIIVAVVIVLLLVLMVFIIVRRRKKRAEDERPAPVPNAPFSPEYRPYPKGQYQSYMQQGYAGPPSFGPSPGIPPSRPMPSPGTHVPPTMSPVPQMQLPPYAGSPVNAHSPPADTPSPLPAMGSLYSLPTFSTDAGPQQLDRLALPPASAGMENDIFPVTQENAFTGNFPAPQPIPEAAGVFPPIVPDVAPAGPFIDSQQAEYTADPAPPAMPADVLEVPIMGVPQQSEHDVDLVPAALPADVPPVPSAVPPQADSAAGILPRTDLEKAFSFEASALPIPGTPAAEIAPFGGLPPVPEGLPPDSAPPPVPSLPAESSMQCHSCSHIYSVTIAELPAIVTCPVCQTQGMVEYL